MAYWWVSQNKTYKEERTGGYLWAPLFDRGGLTPHHWQTVSRLAPGDIVFSYRRRKIPAFAVVSSMPFTADAPTDFQRKGDWSKDGLSVTATYEDVSPPLAIPTVTEQLMKLLPPLYSPLNINGDGNQGYLFELPGAAGRFLLDQIGAAHNHAADEVIERAVSRTVPESTEKTALIKSRVGQGKFRDDVVAYWSGRCAVTGLDILLLLRASHIKPWRDSTNYERLDPSNGLLLSAPYDAAFDIGHISFADDGAVMVGKLLRGKENLAGVSDDAGISHLIDAHREYLKYHRDQIFDRQS